MNINDFFSTLFSFPVNVFFIPFVVFSLIMLVDLVFNVVDGFTADLDIFDLDNIPGSGLLLPPVLSKVPLTVAMCVSFFIATVAAFYVSLLIHSQLSGIAILFANLISIPLIAYAGLAVSSWVLKPLIPLFDKKKAFATVDFVGLRARVHSSIINEYMGEIVVLHKGSEFLLDAVSEPDIDIQYGDDVIIVSKDSTSSRYFVAKADR
ncbi:DUF1449 domain-containing protein [Veronia pacifica]|uniref:DUF1449 domain-containing protein n=2 Tax=Veronia pacifica TaxID=1080227 RepID=A0A1C3ER68_9GAMM|nr:DUF1449 domain-containing protein [Veronia pacifica]ODA35744.1 DUF1449 domain-containing protein [Veronia pacifica]